MIPEHIARADWYDGQLKELSVANINNSLLVEIGIVKRRDKEGVARYQIVFSMSYQVYLKAKCKLIFFFLSK